MSLPRSARESDLVVLMADGSVLVEADAESQRSWLDRTETRYAIDHVGLPLRVLDLGELGICTGSIDDFTNAGVYICARHDLSNAAIGASSTPKVGSGRLAHVPTVTIDSRWDDGAELRSTESKGTGVFARRAFDAGELVFVVTGLAAQTRTRMTVQVGRDRHIEPSVLCAHANHSCDPNVGVRDNTFGTYDVVALKPIVVGDEITIDYDTFESEIVSDDLRSCACGTALCRGKAIGYDSLPIECRERYGELIAAHLIDSSST